MIAAFGVTTLSECKGQCPRLVRVSVGSRPMRNDRAVRMRVRGPASRTSMQRNGAVLRGRPPFLGPLNSE
jgi:hypothetical protein